MDRLDVLATLVQAYEAKHYPINLSDPAEAIRFRMVQGRADAQGSGADDRQAQTGLCNAESQAQLDADDAQLVVHPEMTGNARPDQVPSA